MWNPLNFKFIPHYSIKLSQQGWKLNIEENKKYLFCCYDEVLGEWTISFIIDFSLGKDEDIFANCITKYRGKIPSDKFAKKLFKKGFDLFEL